MDATGAAGHQHDPVGIDGQVRWPVLIQGSQAWSEDPAPYAFVPYLYLPIAGAALLEQLLCQLWGRVFQLQVNHPASHGGPLQSQRLDQSGDTPLPREERPPPGDIRGASSAHGRGGDQPSSFCFASLLEVLGRSPGQVEQALNLRRRRSRQAPRSIA